MSTKKILVVDDNIVVVKTLQLRLSMAGFAVCTALDGGEAIGLVRREKPDLILLDINFPPDVANGGGVAWDGFLIMQWLRRQEEAKATPIIIITGGNPEKYRDQAIKLGATAFFTKPLDHPGLIDMIRHTLDPVAPAPAS